jgi:hypothetical protein
VDLRRRSAVRKRLAEDSERLASRAVAVIQAEAAATAVAVIKVEAVATEAVVAVETAATAEATAGGKRISKSFLPSREGPVVVESIRRAIFLVRRPWEFPHHA